MSVCNQALVKSTDELSLYEQISKILVEIGGYHFVWIGLIRKNQKNALFPVAKAGYEKGYPDLICQNKKTRFEPYKKAIQTGKLFIVQNIQSSRLSKYWRENAKNYNYASFIALPIFINKQLIGVLNVYSSKVNASPKPEVG